MELAQAKQSSGIIQVNIRIRKVKRFQVPKIVWV